MIEIIDNLPTLTGKMNVHYALNVSTSEAYTPWLRFFTQAFEQTSPTQRLVSYAEVLWAAKDVLDVEGWILLGQIAHFAAVNSLYSMEKYDRGLRIFGAAKRELNEGDQDLLLDPPVLTNLIPIEQPIDVFSPE